MKNKETDLPFSAPVRGGDPIIDNFNYRGSSKKMLGVAIIIILVVISMMTLSVISYRQEKTNRRSCASNLKNIMTMMNVYAGDWGGVYPPLDGAAGLEILRANGYFENYKVYLCPSTSSTGKDGAMLTEDIVDYHYFGGYQKTDGKDIPIMLDKQGNHKNYVNVTYFDARVTGFAGSNAWDEQYSKAREIHGRIVVQRRDLLNQRGSKKGHTQVNHCILTPGGG